jgi:hypothetical protein
MDTLAPMPAEVELSKFAVSTGYSAYRDYGGP